MPKLQAETEHAEAIASRLAARGLPHLRTRKYRELVIIESGPKDEPIAHARLRRDTVQYWTARDRHAHRALGEDRLARASEGPARAPGDGVSLDRRARGVTRRLPPRRIP